MKFRNGFVSNSSSSSFTCQTCNTTYSGWDCSPRDFDHQECRNGHIFCCEFLKETDYDKDLDKFINLDTQGLIPDNYWNEIDYINKYGLGDDDLCDGLPEKYCPVCSMNIICNDDCIAYLYKKYSTNNKELADEIKKKFSSYDEFREYLKS